MFKYNIFLCITKKERFFFDYLNKTHTFAVEIRKKDNEKNNGKYMLVALLQLQKS